MSKYVIDEKTLIGIADAIRSKKGTSEPVLTENFAAEIEGIGNDTLNGLIDRSIKEITIPDGITSIGQAIFWACQQLKEVNMPDSITSIGSYGFYYCSGLESLSFSKNLTGIGSNVFYNCLNCKTFDFSRCTDVPTLGSNAFTSINAEAKIIVPADLYTQWVTATNWDKQRHFITSRVTVPYGEEWGGLVYFDDVWAYGDSRLYLMSSATPFKAYCKDLENGNVSEITNENPLFNSWGFEWQALDDGSGEVYCRFVPQGTGGFDRVVLSVGRWEIWIEDSDGNKIYSRVVEVTE